MKGSYAAWRRSLRRSRRYVKRGVPSGSYYYIRWWEDPARSLRGSRSVRQLWLTVALLRRQAGDLESAARARRNAAMASRGRRTARYRPPRDPYRDHQVHWQAWEDRKAPACNDKSGGHKLSADAVMVTCCNCKRTRQWKRLVGAMGE